MADYTPGATELALLKTDLGLLTTASETDAFLRHLLAAAFAAIVSDGLTPDVREPLDLQLLIMYAAWLYRKRDSGGAMPRMLEYALHSAQLRHMGGTT